MNRDSQLADLPVSSDDFENFHYQSQCAALEILTEFFKTNSKKFKNPSHLQQESKTQLAARISKECMGYSLRNGQKIGSFQAQVLKRLSAAQQEFADAMKVMARGIRDEMILKSKAAQLSTLVRSKFENFVGLYFLDKTTLTDHLSLLDSHMDELVTQYVTVVEMKQREDEVAVQGTMVDARQFYSDQMKTARESKSWYPVDEFKRINDRVLGDTVSKFTEEGTLTPEQSALLRQSLQGLYSKFEEENDSFIPKCSLAIGIDLGTTYSCVGVPD